jgi:hypothetical protein
LFERRQGKKHGVLSSHGGCLLLFDVGLAQLFVWLSQNFV